MPFCVTEKEVVPPIIVRSKSTVVVSRGKTAKMISLSNKLWIQLCFSFVYLNYFAAG